MGLFDLKVIDVVSISVASISTLLTCTISLYAIRDVRKEAKKGLSHSFIYKELYDAYVRLFEKYQECIKKNRQINPKNNRQENESASHELNKEMEFIVEIINRHEILFIISNINPPTEDLFSYWNKKDPNKSVDIIKFFSILDNFLKKIRHILETHVALER